MICDKLFAISDCIALHIARPIHNQSDKMTPAHNIKDGVVSIIRW